MNKTIFICQQCAAEFPKWNGQCGNCYAWNTLVEERSVPTQKSARGGYAGRGDHRATKLSDVPIQAETRISTSSSEFDRVLGGGIVSGSAILVGGDPGIGKSTLLLQTLHQLQQKHGLKTLYVSGEESLQQIKLRAERFGIIQSDLLLLTETSCARIIEHLQKLQPHAVIIDSIQTMASEHISSAPGSVSQVRESAASLVRYAKENNVMLFIVGHVTKEGALAGPRVLEHMVDCVLYFETQTDQRFRLIRAIKNRFGAVNEVGIFAMTERGLKDVTNPSALFLSRPLASVAGSIVMATWEGTRALLVEIQALVSPSYGMTPKRVAVGFDNNRLAMLLAVLQKQTGITTHDQDIFVNVVGGLRITETAIDLPILLAIASSRQNKCLPELSLAFGEVGLAGELRPVQYGQERIHTAEKQGFRQILLPKANIAKNKSTEIQQTAVDSVSAALETVL